MPFEVESTFHLSPWTSKNSNHDCSHDRRCRQQVESRKVGNNYIRSVFGFFFSFSSRDLETIAVRKYVEGMKNSAQLLDLLANVGIEDTERTKAAPDESDQELEWEDEHQEARFFTSLSKV